MSANALYLVVGQDHLKLTGLSYPAFFGIVLFSSREDIQMRQLMASMRLIFSSVFINKCGGIK